MKYLTAILAFLFLLALAAAANAADAGTTLYPVNIQEPLSYLASLLFAVLGAVGGFFVSFLSKKAGIKLTPEANAHLSHALAAAVLFGHQRAQSYISQIDKPTVRSLIVAQVVNQISASVPLFLKELGLTPEKLTELVENRLYSEGVFDGPARPSE